VTQIAWTDPEARRHGVGLAEFDEGNLIALSRFPEFDRYERDWRAAVGLGWTRLASGGDEYSVTAGQLFRKSREDMFLPGSGISGNGSDWLLSARVKRDRLTLSARSLIDAGTELSRLETRVAWEDGLTSASGRYIWSAAIPGTRRADLSQGLSELLLDASRRIYRHWTVSIDGRYDRSAGRTTKAGLGLTYRNECVTVDISASRRFSTSGNASVPEATELSIGLSLNGFGRDPDGPERSCGIRQRQT